MGMMIRKSKHQVVTLKRQRIHEPRILCEPEMAHNNDLRLDFRYIRAQAFRNNGAPIMNRALSSFVGALRSRGGSFCDSVSLRS
jgi:hypothetical protein